MPWDELAVTGDDPQDPLARPDGTDPPHDPEEALRQARWAVFRAGASDADRQRFERLRGEQADRAQAAAAALDDTEGGRRTSPQPAPGPAVPSSVLPHRRVRARSILGAAAGVVLVGAAVTSIVTERRAPLPHPRPSTTLFFDAKDLADIRRALPGTWRTTPITVLSESLDGNTALTARRSANPRALLVVRCPAEDRSFQAVVTDGTIEHTLYGPCGRQWSHVVAVWDGGHPSSVLVTTRGIQPFTAAVLQP